MDPVHETTTADEATESPELEELADDRVTVVEVLDLLTGFELRMLRKELGTTPWHLLAGNDPLAMYGVVWAFRRRSNAKLTFDAVLDLEYHEVLEAWEELADEVGPTVRSRRNGARTSR